MGTGAPTVMLLDGDYDNTLAVARELTEDLDARIVGAGTSRYSRLLRSKYCDVGVVVPPTDDARFADAILDQVYTHHPQVVLPISYGSMAALQSVRSILPQSVSIPIPPVQSFRAAEDKATTLRYGDRVGLDTPTEYTDLVEDLDDDGRPAGKPDESAFPLFLKARKENGRTTTALADDPSSFWETYDRLVEASPNGEVLVQEYVDGCDSTYGCGLLFLDGDVELIFSHEELRSVPRRGGSGTHLRIVRHPHLEAKSIRLLREIGWNGIALVEFKRRPDGSFVLMEINPKFWASYALASAYGYRFASTMVANVLDLEIEQPVGSPTPTGEMAFPLRELYFYVQNRDDGALRDCLGPVARPGVAWDVDLGDLGAWLTPPVDFVRKMPGVETSDSTDERRRRTEVVRT